MSTILVTGDAGFIGSAYVRHRLASRSGDEVRVLDKLTYAGREENLAGLEGCELVVGDIADADAERGAIEGCDARQLRGRVARRSLDRVARRVHPDGRVRHLRAARSGPRGWHPP